MNRPVEKPAVAVVHLVGTTSNRSAIGARLEVTGTATHYYTVRSTGGFQSQNSDWMTVVVGETGEATLRVLWPSGNETVTTIAVGDRIEITE